MLRYGFVLFCLLLAGCASNPPDTHAADVASLTQAELEWAKDGATKDVDKWMTHYTDDASVLLPNTPIISGKAAIRSGMVTLMADPNWSVTFAPNRVEVAKSADLGFTQGVYTMTSSDPKTKASVTEKGKYLTVYRKTGSAWLAVEDTFMTDAPPTEPQK